MGIVYKALQTKLGRIVALKVLLGGSLAGERDIHRFQKEAQTLGRLQHSNIVQVFEVGEHQGLPFFALEYCPQGSLASFLQGRHLSALDAAQLVSTLAIAMAAAHQAGVIHRDLKPANVLLAADGSPKIGDFGLAKKQDESGLTASGAVMGTPNYMAPEQARGDHKQIGPAADIYALGGILYECLTGRPPFQGGTALETMCHVLEQEPIPPRKLQPSVPSDLETICLKCLAKSPQNRYSSADALAADLARFQRQEPIQARRTHWTERLWRRIRRNPVTSALILTVMILITSVVFLSLSSPRNSHSPLVIGPSTSQDDLQAIIQELDRTDPGWRLEELDKNRPPLRDEDNSALRLQAAYKLLPSDWQKRYDHLQESKPHLLAVMHNSGPVPPEDLVTLRDLRQSVEPALREALAMADLPQGRHPVKYNRTYLETSFDARSVYAVASLLHLSFSEQLHLGNHQSACRVCRALINLGRSMHNVLSTTSQLQRIAAVQTGLGYLEVELAHGSPGDSELQAIQKILEREAQEDLLLLVAKTYRGEMHWFMSAVKAGDKKMAEFTWEKGRLKEELQDLPQDPEARQKQHALLLRHLNSFVEIARLPAHEQTEKVTRWQEEGPYWLRGISDILPMIARSCLVHNAKVRCAWVAVAVERYRMRHSRWPSSLGELKSDFLNKMPFDPFDGKPLRYRVLPDGIVVYSIGPNLQDDGGVEVISAPVHSDGDICFRLWNPERRVK
jgi:serine/threonine protein kinase